MGAFTDPAFQETQFYWYQPPRIPAILSGRSACFSAGGDFFVSIRVVGFSERIQFAG
jgi:hypothetical protein